MIMLIIAVVMMVNITIPQVPLHTLIKITPVAYGCQVRDDHDEKDFNANDIYNDQN